MLGTALASMTWRAYRRVQINQGKFHEITDCGIGAGADRRAGHR